jgi:L-asparaginase II
MVESRRTTETLPGVVCLRNGILESFHRVHVVLADHSGRVLASVGRRDLPVVYRSAAKPFQAVPLVEDGVVDRFGLTASQLALAAASHNGEPEHLRGVLGILHRVGCTEEELGLGPLLPLGPEAAEALLRSGNPVRSIHNNCSGQHAAMLGLAKLHGWPLDSYLEGNHPLQRRMLAEMARFTGLREEEIPTMVDGCGMVAFAVPLESMALSFARLAAASAVEEGPRRILQAMAHHPFMVGGTGRLCTRLAEATGGRLVGKLGAEGVYGIAFPGDGLGLAVKVEDGGMRAGDPAVIRALDQLGLLRPQEGDALGSFRKQDIRNSRGEIVGEMRGTFVFEGGSSG